MQYTHLRKGKLDPLEIEFKDGTTYLFSYEKPLAAYVPGRGFFRVKGTELGVTNKARVAEFMDKRNAVGDEITYPEMVQILAAHMLKLGEGAK